MKQNAYVFAGIVLTLGALTGCESSGTTTAPPAMSAAPVLAPAGNSVEEAARQACLRAVMAETNNPTASVQSSDFSEAGTRVVVGVGPQNAPWECIAYSNGSTTRPMSLTNEGSL